MRWRGRWRGREVGGEEYIIVCTDSDFASHDSKLISLIIQ